MTRHGADAGNRDDRGLGARLPAGTPTHAEGALRCRLLKPEDTITDAHAIAIGHEILGDIFPAMRD